MRSDVNESYSKVCSRIHSTWHELLDKSLGFWLGTGEIPSGSP